MKMYTFDGLVPFVSEPVHARVVVHALLACSANLTYEPQFEAVCEELLQALYRDGDLNNDDALTFRVIRYRNVAGVLVAKATFYATSDMITIPVGVFTHSLQD